MAEVNQPARCGTGISIDCLVVVANREHCARRSAEQSDEEQVRGREVLELVHEEHAS